MDASAFIAGLDPFSINMQMATTPTVEEEIKIKCITTLRFRTAVESGRLKIVKPLEKFIEKAKSAAKRLGDKYFLSETDIQILALALEFESIKRIPQIITDDYSIQNVAKEMGLKFKPLTTLGIKKIIEWVRYCPACYKNYPLDNKKIHCDICGTKLKRKPKKSKKIG